MTLLQVVGFLTLYLIFLHGIKMKIKFSGSFCNIFVKGC